MKNNYHIADPHSEIVLVKSIISTLTSEDSNILCKLAEYQDKKGNLYHNSIGCNLSESLSAIGVLVETFHEALTAPKSSALSIEVLWSTLIMHMHIISQEFEEVIKASGLSHDSFSRNFEQIMRIKYLANFLKHPKTKLFLQHPNVIYTASTASHPNNYVNAVNSFKKESQSLILSEKDIKKYYTGKNDNKDKDFMIKYANKENVAVLIPSIADIAEGFRDAVIKLVSMYDENPILHENLLDVSCSLSGNIDEMIDAYEAYLDSSYDRVMNR